MKTALEGEDTDAIKSRSEELAQVAMQMGQKIYEAQQAEAGTAEATTAEAEEAAGGDDDVVDAEFSEVDEDNKS